MIESEEICNNTKVQDKVRTQVEVLPGEGAAFVLCLLPLHRPRQRLQELKSEWRSSRHRGVKAFFKMSLRPGT